MDSIDAFRDLLMSLADVYAQEDREGARVLVDVYRAAAQDTAPTPSPPYQPMNAAILASTETAKTAAAKAARAAHSVLPWARTGKLDEQITKEVSDVFSVAILVGPGALIHNETVMGGLFVQRSGALYPAHAHAAEETYAMIAGTAEWQKDFGEWEEHKAGELIHHPTNIPHATRTRSMPIMAAWRWSGDIRPSTYRMCEAPESQSI